MAWEILFNHEFEGWFDTQEESLKERIASILDILAEEGSLLGRPYVDTIKESFFTNMKELRVQHEGRPWRILFCFDPRRRAILLVGGDKSVNKRWYKESIRIADKRFQEHLSKMDEKEGENL